MPPINTDEQRGFCGVTMQWPFKDWGADLVLSGHSHAYERLHVGGLTYIVNGACHCPDAGALLIQANEHAMTLQYQLRGGDVVDTITLGA